MKPPKATATTKSYEKVPVGKFVEGIIEEVQYDPEHPVREYGKKGEDDYRPAGTMSAVRLKFKIKGCDYPKYSRWMRFSYKDNSTLFSKFLLALVEGAKEYFDFDLDQLTGFPVRMIWSDNVKDPNFQKLELILPDGKKLVPGAAKEEPDESPLEDPDEEVPF